MPLILCSLLGTGKAQSSGEDRVAQAHEARIARTRQFLNGRRVWGGGSPAGSLAEARREHLEMVQGALVHAGAKAALAAPQTTILSTAWTAVGPAQVGSALYGNVTGRVTAIAIDPADATGNTIYVGTTGGGVWKSTNAAGAAASVSFVPLTDTLPVFSAGLSVIPSLSIGSLAMGGGVLLAGTGDPNDATDSYYGAGILRSADGGVTWTLVQQSLDGVSGNHSFTGLSVAGLAFSTTNQSLVVAALSRSAEGDLVNAQDNKNSVSGLYWSSDAGVTWQMGTVLDGSQTVQTPLPIGGNAGGNPATSVVWNSVRQRFYAAVRFHGYYQSADGMTWTRLAHQPGVGLTLAGCPTNPGSLGSTACPIFRGVLAVQPVTGDTFALTTDVYNGDQGLYQDACAMSGSACANATVLFANKLNSTPLEVSGAAAIAQGDYDLALAASPSGTDTLLYVGTIDLFRCSLAAGCTLRNTTNAQNGCVNPARVAPAQHAIATLAKAGGPLLYLGNDGGLYRSSDGVNEFAGPCALDDANHFQNLNGGLGSLAEVVSFAQAPADAGTLLVGVGALGTAGTGAVNSSWPQLSAGEGGVVAIDQTNPLLWYISTGAGVSIARCTKGSACAARDFAATAIGTTQVAGDGSVLDAPWLLDPALDTNLIVGTCRVWRGSTTGGNLWSSANAISAPFGTPLASACGSTSPAVRSLAVGGGGSSAAASQNAGSAVIYAGLAGYYDGGGGFGGQVFTTTTANAASNTTAWTDAGNGTVTNDSLNKGVFNAGGFDVSAIVADSHDASGNTVYATILGFSANGYIVPHLYRSIDAGLHWTNISSNLPNDPANAVLVDPNDANTVYVALDTGVYVTSKVTTCTSGNCWSVYGSGLPNTPVVALAAAPLMPTGDGRTGELRVATYGRGIWQIPLLTASGGAVPSMTTSPTTLNYTSVAVGAASAYVSVTVTNTGSGSLLVSSVTATGDFNEIDTCVGAAVTPGATCTVQVRFAPTVTGARSGVLTVYANVAGGQATVALNGMGTPSAAITLNPTALTFPTTSVGATSVVENITINNINGPVINLQTPVVNGDFRISANTCGATVGAQTSCTVSIIFSPTAAGNRGGTLTVVDDAGTQVASLSGVSTNPATDSLSPLTLSFASQQLSSASATQVVTLVNSGDAALTLINAQITSGDFTVVNNCGTSLNGHASCTFTVGFVPKNLGQESGVLTISDQFRSQTVQLSGSGAAPAGVSVAPIGTLSFGATGVGMSSALQTVTLTNNGGVTLNLTSLTLSGDFALTPGANTCGQTLAPGGVCTAGVVFTPTGSGARVGSVTFVDSAVNSPQVILLSGTGVDFSLAVYGPSSFTLATGQAATYALLLTSAANVPGIVAFTCTGVPAHTLCTVNPANAGLGTTSSVTVTVATGLSTVRLDAPRMPWTRPSIWVSLLLPAGLVWRRRRAMGVLLVLLCSVVLMAGSGCSQSRLEPSTTGGSSSGGVAAVTPSGTYPLVVTGTSAGLTRTVSLTLIVQ